MTEREIFNIVRELPDSQREGYLLKACGDDEALKKRIRELIQSQHELDVTLDSKATMDLRTRDIDLRTGMPAKSQSGSFEIEPPPTVDSDGSSSNDSTLKVGDQIGPYSLRRPLGKGGMGEVWVAEQFEPVKRQVALKLIKGVGSKEIIARFEAERQALALMNHPNIARILDAGTTNIGQPYFVMELVEGKPLTTHCDDNKLSIEDRLKMFLDVCAGVQHAHQKGIIHRDLKPGNIIVGMLDGQAVPKVIDFGLAKAMESTQRLTDQSLFTGIGQILGTLKYMSPEQASLDILDIDTRADIYALGVILYELLTGCTPLDDTSIRGQAAFKVLEYIREKEPVKPSSKLGNSTDEQVSTITDQRKTDGTRLKQILLGDLDWIVMKSLEKDRARRYESASGFAADIRRYLSSEPIIARPPSVTYRLRKFVRKNRIGVIAASIVALSLTGGFVGTSLALIRALAAERLSVMREKQTDIARQSADKNLEIATKNLAFARSSNEILNAIFDNLTPESAATSDVDLRSRLAQNLELAADEIEASPVGEPADVAGMELRLGLSLIRLGKVEQAAKVLEMAKSSIDGVNNAHPALRRRIQNGLASVYFDLGQFDKCIPLLEELILVTEKDVPQEKQAIIEFKARLAAVHAASRQIDLIQDTPSSIEEATDRLEDPMRAITIEMARMESGTDSDDVTALSELVGDLEKQLGEDHPATINAIGALGEAHRRMGQYDLAKQFLDRCLRLGEEKLGNNHPITLNTINNFALLELDTGELDAATERLSEVLPRMNIQLGKTHQVAIIARSNLATMFYRKGDIGSASRLCDELLDQYKPGETTRTAVVVQAAVVGFDCAFESGNFGKGFEYLEKIAALKPEGGRPEFERRKLSGLVCLGMEAEAMIFVNSVKDEAARTSLVNECAIYLTDAIERCNLSENTETARAICRFGTTFFDSIKHRSWQRGLLELGHAKSLEREKNLADAQKAYENAFSLFEEFKSQIPTKFRWAHSLTAWKNGIGNQSEYQSVDLAKISHQSGKLLLSNTSVLPNSEAMGRISELTAQLETEADAVGVLRACGQN